MSAVEVTISKQIVTPSESYCRLVAQYLDCLPYMDLDDYYDIRDYTVSDEEIESVLEFHVDPNDSF